MDVLKWLKNTTGIILHVFNLVLTAAFAVVYMSLGHEHFNGLDSNSTFLDYFYFSFTTMSTVGYGDISPISQKAKIIVLVHQQLILVELAALIAGAVSHSSMDAITKSLNTIIKALA